jgi:hypothetical protein
MSCIVLQWKNFGGAFMQHGRGRILPSSLTCVLLCVVLLCMQVLNIIDNQLYGPSQAKLKM